MTKQEQIKEMANLMAETMLKNFGLRYKDFAETLYNAGYRKIDCDNYVSREWHGEQVLHADCGQAWDNGYKDGYKSGVEDFAEKLKKCTYCDNDFMDGKWHRYVLIEDIERIAKEFLKYD